MKKVLAIVTLVLMIVSTMLVSMPTMVFAANTTYYVDSVGGNDSNNGTSTGTAWKSISKVNATTFGAGDRILLKRGCSWSGELHPLGSGISGSPIVIDAYGTGNLPIINGGGTVYQALYLYNQQYWEVNNLELTNMGSTVARRRGVHIGGENAGTLNHIYLNGLVVHGVNGDSKKDADASGGIAIDVWGTTTPTKFNDIKIENCKVYDVARQGITTNNTWCTLDDGIGGMRTSYFDATAFTNFVVQNCTLYDIDGDGIVPIACKNAVVQYNVAYNTARCYYNPISQIPASVAMWPWNSDDTVIQFNEVYLTHNNGDGCAFDGDYLCNGTIIQYNYSHNNEGGFALVCSPDTSRYSNWNVIRYNISQNDGTAGRPLIRLAGVGVYQTSIYNNTISVPAGNQAVKVIAREYWGEYPITAWIENNVFYIPTAISTDDNWDFYYTNNCYYGMSAPAEDTKKVTADPKLVSPNSGSNGMNTVDGYKLQSGSPCLGTGKVIGNNGGRDYWGNTVSATAAPNMGAYNGAGIVTATNLVSNPGFETDGATQTPSNWLEWNNTSASYTETNGGAYSGTYHATHWQTSAYTVSTYKNMTGLTNGVYTMTAWVKSSGGQTTAQMYVKNFGGTEKSYSVNNSISDWTQITISNISVTNGQAELGFYSVANANNYLFFDDVSFTKN